MDAGEKIGQGELRLGSWVDRGEYGAYMWKHWYVFRVFICSRPV
jgi:hypothetical protein